ncbi:MAG: sodium-dependent transporter [Marinobacter sp.]|uniref:sodium-dependent transporter n=1 Tax=Marinobacter sp. TaxID=50741 RepID=UPI001B3E313B|nr:sodium-dependent transporter [Marinobacter sp.]MBQ0746021.1 sodium-dependent transporter [Marinobacter sp.]MBQ0814514.1 sodium-dependent transporter [Marinobacter sp.]|tara:strand:- start:2167 stop:3564 length:1398 start_codon:yes stop_codon:yes gene_type:complete
MTQLNPASGNDTGASRGLWSSRFAFILAATGSAVGLGNIWKFPYVTGENGGGAFVLVYLLCIAVIGIPIMMAEIFVGRSGRHNPIGSMRLVAERNLSSPAWRISAVIGMIAAFAILSFYSVIGGWAASYIGHAAMGDFTNGTADSIGELFSSLLASPKQLLAWHTLFMALVILVVSRGLKGGLERAVTILMPALFVLLLIAVGYATTTGHFGEAASFLFTPNFGALTINGVLIALGHAFFTLSLGMAIMMAYGSYLGRDVPVGRTAVSIALMDTVVALLAGLAIFPVVFANGLEASAGPGLIFQTLPLAFGNMPMGGLFGTLFFVLLLFAAWTSGISLLEPVVEWVEENTNMERVGSAVVVGVLCWLLGIASILSLNVWADFAPLDMFARFEGKTIFDLLDFFTANILLPLSGLLTAIFVGWFVAKESLKADVNLSRGAFALWLILLRYVSPVAVVIVFVYNLLA